MQNLRPSLERARGGLGRTPVATRILGVTALLLIALVVGLAVVVQRQVAAAATANVTESAVSANNVLYHLTVTQKGPPAIVDGRLRFGEWTVRGDNSIVDAVKETTGNEATLFQLIDGKMVRQATTIRQADGSRAIDTVLQGPAAEAAARGENYTGTGPILDKQYRSRYTIVRDKNNQVVGIVYTGKPTAAIDALSRQITNTTFVVALVGLLLSLGTLFPIVTQMLTRPLRRLRHAAERIGAGDYDVRVPVDRQDELGQVAQAVNTMVDQITTTARAQAAQNESMQRQIIQLLDEVSAVAEGDLTVEAEVTADTLGAVADSFNYMIAELRRIIGRVNAATRQVAASTEEILATTDVLVRSAEQQAGRITDTSTAMEEMAVSIQQVSENAAISAQVAREARASAEAGSQAVVATVAGMGRIRDQVEETARKIQRLGASSQEIGAIVSLIQEVADQTELLALNAAIQAAMAGEHGKGFAVVAEEVRRLAERTGEASRQIGTLVKGIQAETNEAVAAMEEGTREVVSGSQVADEAGRSLQQIDAVAGQLAELIEAISLAAEQQARASAGIARAMGEISAVTHDTTSSASEAAQSVSALAALADDLRSSVAAFRLGDEVAAEPAGAAGGRTGPARELAGAGRR